MNKILALHPYTIQSLEKSHPWVTSDQYSRQFPLQKPLIKLSHPQSQKFYGYFLHDPEHSKIKARFWSKTNKPFEQHLKEKLELAIKKRKNISFQRDNIYFCFGEADEIPGLFIQQLHHHFLIQYYALFWENKLPLIVDFLQKTLRKNAISYQEIWVQKRITGKNHLAKIFYTKKEEPTDQFIIQEHDISYKIYLNKYQDIGIYTDMAAIRQKMTPYFKKASNILNLFSYTGAFTLMGLKHHKKVTSVDLSKKYMEWLQENIRLNRFNEKKHRAHITSCDKAISQFQQEKKQFDLIVSDPPSFSSDGKKKQSGIDFYKKNLQKLISLLTPNGKLIIFINTHQITKEKFKKSIEHVMLRAPKEEKLKIIDELKMQNDCPTKISFPEGDYIKGLVIAKSSL